MRGSPGARLPASPVFMEKQGADRATWGWTRRRGGGFELDWIELKEKGRAADLVNAEHRDEVAFRQAPPRRSISTKTLRMVSRLYDR